MKTIIILFYCILISFLKAQPAIEYHHNWWNSLNGRHALSKKFSLQYEVHVRRENYLKNWYQFLFRPMVNYNWNKTFTLTAGYTYIKNYPYRKSDPAIVIPENNLWQQILYRKDLKYLSFTHYLRYEERYIGKAKFNSRSGKYEINGYIFNTRLRDRIILAVPITHLGKNKDKTIQFVFF